MSIWVIVIIIVILAVLIFGYLYYGKYSGGAKSYSISKDDAVKLINALNNKIKFNDPNGLDDANTGVITAAKNAVLELVKENVNITSKVGAEYKRINLKFYAHIDIDIDIDIDNDDDSNIENVFKVLLADNKCNMTTTDMPNNNYNYKLVKKYIRDLIKIKKSATIDKFKIQLDDLATAQDELNRIFKLLYFNKYIYSNIPFAEDKKLVQDLILTIINVAATEDICVLLKYKYILFKSTITQFDGDDNSYIENFYNTTYQKELIDNINTYIGTLDNVLNDNLIKSMYNYYLNVKDNYLKYLAKDYASWQLDFLAHIPVRHAHNNDFTQIPYYLTTIDVANYINYYHDIEKYKNTTYTYVNDTMKKLSVETIYGIMYDKIDLFKTDQDYKLNDIDGVNPYDTELENVELILLVVQLLDLNYLKHIWEETRDSKKDKLHNVIVNILASFPLTIDDVKLPYNFIINFLKKYNKDKILFNDIETELINQNNSYKIIQHFLPNINNYSDDFWRIMKIKHYNVRNFDILYRINIYGKLMTLKDNGDNIDCLAEFDGVCEKSYKNFTTNIITDLNDEAKGSGEDNKKMKKCVEVEETDTIEPYKHKDDDDDDINDNDECLINKLKITGIIFQHRDKFVFNKYENIKLCNYNINYNYGDYAELFPNNNYNIEYLRENKFYICNDNFINIRNDDKNYLKWELKDVNYCNTEYYTDNQSVVDALSTDVVTFAAMLHLGYTIDYFNGVVDTNYEKYIKNTKCIYFILQNRNEIPEYHNIKNKNIIEINKLYFDYMIKLFPEINIPEIDTAAVGFYTKQFSYKNDIINDGDLVISDMPYGTRYNTIKKVKTYNDLNDKYTNSFTAGRISITSALWNSNTSESKNRKQFDELQKALDKSADVFSPLDTDADGYRKRPNELEEVYTYLTGDQYIDMLKYTKLLDKCIKNYNENVYNGAVNGDNNFILKTNLDKIKADNDKKYVLKYKFTEVFSSLFGEIITMDYKRKNQQISKEFEDEKIITAEIITKEYSQLIKDGEINTKDYEYTKSVTDLQSFLKDCMSDLLSNSTTEEKASIMYMKVDDMAVSDYFKDIEIKGNIPYVYIALYKGDLNTDGIMNELNKQNKLYPKVKRSNKYRQQPTTAKMLAYKKVGDKYVRAPEKDAFYNNY